MSKRLLDILPQSPAASPQGPLPAATFTVHPLLISLCALGVVCLVIWVIMRLNQRKKFSLEITPGRANSINPGFLLIVFCLQFLPSALAMLAMHVERLSCTQAITYGLAGQLLALAAALVVAKFGFRRGLLRGLGLSLRHWGFDTARGIFAYLAVLPVCIGLVLICGEIIPERFQQSHPMLNALQELGTPWRFLITFSAVVAAPLAEELLFRGLLQSMLRRVLAPWPTILIASLLFAIAHSQPQNVPSLFVLGIVLGYNYERCGRLWPAILIHMLFNGVMITQQLAP